MRQRHQLTLRAGDDLTLLLGLGEPEVVLELLELLELAQLLRVQLGRFRRGRRFGGAPRLQLAAVLGFVTWSLSSHPPMMPGPSRR